MPKNKAIRVVIDTNLWVSFVISKQFNSLDALLFSEDVRLLFSIELIEEIQSTISKPKLKNHFSSNSIEEMLSIFDSFIDLVKVKTKVSVCRDPKDDFFYWLWPRMAMQII